MGDVTFGYVYDFGTGEEWTAERGGGAFLDGARLGALRPEGDDRDPLLRGHDDARRSPIASARRARASPAACA